MNFKMFIQFAKSVPSSKAVYMRGIHGIGKTSLAKVIADHFGQRLVTFNLSQLADVSDLIGMPTKVTLTSAEGKEYTSMTWAAPFWYNPGEPVTILLDEFPRARMEVRNAVMQLLLEHRVLDKELAPGSRILLAGNPAKFGIYDAETLDMALVDRVAICDLEPTFEESLDYLQSVHCHKAVIEYLSKNRNDLLPFTNYTSQEVKQLGEEKLPSPRSWDEFGKWLNEAEKANKFKKLDQTFVEVGTSAYLGAPIAKKFWPFYNDASAQFSAEDILEGWSTKMQTIISELDTPTISVLMNNIVLWCKSMGSKEPTEKNKKNFKHFFNSLQPEVKAAIARDQIQKSILSGEDNSIVMLIDDELQSFVLELAASSL